MFSYEKTVENKWNETKFFHSCTTLAILVLCNSVINRQNIFISQNNLHTKFMREKKFLTMPRVKHASENNKNT